MTVNNFSTDLIAQNTALALSFAQMAGETMDAIASQSMAFWGAALQGTQAQPSATSAKTPTLSIVPPATKPKKAIHSTARSWYRQPVDSPVETMMKFWGSFMPEQQPITPWLPPASSAMPSMAMPPLIQAAAQSNGLDPLSMWASLIPWKLQPATTTGRNTFDMMNAAFWLSQPSHNGWTKSSHQEISDAWNWVSQSWMSDPFGQAKR